MLCIWRMMRGWCIGNGHCKAGLLPLMLSICYILRQKAGVFGLLV